MQTMVTVCQQCGDRGFEDALIYCEQCQNYSIHLYCLDVPAENIFDEDITWLCVDCEPKVIKRSTIDKSVRSTKNCHNKKLKTWVMTWGETMVMDAEKNVQPKGQHEAESNLEHARVGREAFFNFMKNERDEMGQVASAKSDTKVKEKIVNKWRKFNSKEKATYGFTIEGRSGQVNELANEKGFMTRCNPERFRRTVEKLSKEKRLTINAIGFGNLSSISCTRLHRPLCNFLVQRFNPDTSSIELHGNVFGISVVDFGRVMGLKNTGEDVELSGSVQDEKVKESVKSFCGNGKRVLISDLAEKLEKCENADDDFKVRFVMFALSTVLCPTSSLSVTRNYLTFLRIPGKIESMNWADHAFNFLRDGVRSFKMNKVAYVNGSLIFLQLFYFDSIVHGGVYVDKSLDPIVSWDNKSACKLIKWVKKQGGLDSPTVRVVSRCSITNEFFGVH